ncbi:GlsB/YeaQ/YmgE family stress response membrane protein [Actinopolymorpha sp. B9G3]|uniref:GlsB/YeaQ/YmgE family stress response membrane protein n=1 Tax=Actinopolymorpha sp. B9G3 TaxID=3158970 RepID=UPI0032D8D009
MGIIAFLILGLICGAIAKFLLPGNDPGGLIVTLVIGVAGALLGGFLAGVLFNTSPIDEFWDLSSWLTAIIGSVLVLLVWRAVAGRTRR